MQRQKSIRSFFQTPLPANQKPGEISTGELFKAPQFPLKQQSQSFPVVTRLAMAEDSGTEIRGTDTPPEKVPRPVFTTKLTANDENSNRPSLFSSIMHKFVKVDNREKSSQRKQENDGSSNTGSIFSKLSVPNGLSKRGTASEHADINKVPIWDGTFDQGSFSLLDIDNDVPSPETPGMKPNVPRMKRMQDDVDTLKDKNICYLMNSSKRAKPFQELRDVSEKHGPTSVGIASKFEWLDPSRLRDANGRRPGDALYDKRTLYIPPDAMKKMSASQKQYWSVKCQYMDVMLFFKVGKFYELYELDAEIGHRELDWKMTFSGVGKCRQVGISESGIDDAVQKLIARGYKVGRIEQLETSEQAKARGANSVIQRKLVNVVTPSTTVDENIGPDAIHVLALKEGSSDLENGSSVYGFAFVDCTALKFSVGSIRDDASFAALGALLMQLSPKEIVYESRGMSKEAQKAFRNHSLSGSIPLQLSPVQTTTDFPDAFEVRNLIKSEGYFKGSSFFEYAPDSISHHDLALSALGGLISHLSRLMLNDILRNGDIVPYQVFGGCLRMDGQTLVNLEIFNNSADGGYSGTLYKYLNNCITPSGKRLLRSWICHPLRDVEEINHRLNVVEIFVAQPEVTLLISQYLLKLPDLERFLGRIRASAHSSATLIMPFIGKRILKQQVRVFGSLVKGLQACMDLLMLLQKEGHMNSSLLRILNLPALGGSDGLCKFLSKFDVAVEGDFPNYQDHEVTDADAEILSILIELFVEKAKQFSQVIQAIKCLDVLRSFAVNANSTCGAMSRPKFIITTQEQGGPVLKIEGLWHPFALGESGRTPVPNDINLGQGTEGYHPRTLLLTGPNMGGKSTLLRATCVAVILAQMGSYVPCDTCVLSPADIIFTRLGATDRIMTGESTFFIECTETASVLQNATQDSLVLLDELGRGTSTFDGYAIAYAVFRHLIEKVNCRLLFATHYHPLTKEFASHPHVLLQHMACAFRPKSQNSLKDDQELVFLYRLTPGACPESYGLQVARMAGIPNHVVESAFKAGQLMKASIGESFKSSEQRSEFSTLHEGWLRTLVLITNSEGNDAGYDEDTFDTLFCLWHELKSSYRASVINA